MFCQKSTRKLRFCITSVLVSTNMIMTLFRKHFLMEQNNSQRPYRPKIAGILLFCNDPAQFACWLACNTSEVNTLPLKAAIEYLYTYRVSSTHDLNAIFFFFSMDIISPDLFIYLFIMSYLPRSTPSVRSIVLPGAPALHA